MCHQTVGLVQAVIEEAGIPTVSVSVRPEITCGVGVPRGAYVRFPTGAVFGPPGFPEVQQDVLASVIALFETMERPGFVELPFRWRRWKKS